jgi:hypothetical protein
MLSAMLLAARLSCEASSRSRRATLATSGAIASMIVIAIS